MADNNILKQITDLVIQQTVNKKIPTVVFLSEEVTKSDLFKNIAIRLTGNDEIFSDSFTPWQLISDIMLKLAEIPLLLKETSDIKDIQSETENFIKSLDKDKGLVIIDSKDDIFTSVPFTKKENISIIILGAKG